MRFRAFLVSVLTSVSPAVAGSLAVIDVPSQGLEACLEIQRDDTRALTVDQVRNGTGFRRAGTSTPNPGYTLAAWWLRCTFTNANAVRAERVIEISYPLIDDLRYYVLENDVLIEQRTTGRNASFVQRQWKGRTFVFPLTIPGHGSRTVYVRVESQDSLALPITLRTEDGMELLERDRHYLFGLYYGIILVMVLYNLFLFTKVRDSAYLYYVLTLITLHGLFQFSLNGHIMEFFHVSSLFWARDITAAAVAAGVVFALMFCRRFLDVPVIWPAWDRLFRVLVVWGCVDIVLAFSTAFFPSFYYVVILMCVALGYIVIIGMFAGGIVAYRRGFKPARYYLAAWTFLLAGGTLYGLKIWNILPSNAITEYSWQIGSAIEATLLSLALADRITVMQTERANAQKEVKVHQHIAEMAQEELLSYLTQMDSLKDQILSLDTTRIALEALMNHILGTFQRSLGFDRGFMIVNDRFRKTHMVRTDNFSPDIVRSFPNERYLYRLLRVPDDLFDELNFVFTLESGKRRPFDATSPPPAHADLVQVTLETLNLLRDWGLYLCIPLAYKREIFGYMVISKKSDGTTFHVSELKVIETFRHSVAMTIRNAMLYEEVSMLRGQAEEKVNRLSDIIVKEATRKILKEKTLVYTSRAMDEVYEFARRFAGKSQPILITGETGTGKDLIAHAIHEESGADSGPLIAVNCAAIPAHLWESEIFGHVRGAFTDAKSDHAGKVEQAGSGTLFFDEIGEMPIDIQPKMLRLIQERKFQRIGGDKVIEAKCRFVFATNRDLEEMQKRGAFREDLFYRISVLKVALPPLRDRADDIPVLVNFFITKYSPQLGSSVTGISEEAVKAMLAYPWPGNIRELENSIIQAIVNASDETLTLADLPRNVSADVPVPEMRLTASSAMTGLPAITGQFQDMVDAYSRNVISAAMEQCGGNKIEAAKLLGIKRATFYYKLKELGLD